MTKYYCGEIGLQVDLAAVIPLKEQLVTEFYKVCAQHNPAFFRVYPIAKVVK